MSPVSLSLQLSSAISFSASSMFSLSSTVIYFPSLSFILFCSHRPSIPTKGSIYPSFDSILPPFSLILLSVLSISAASFFLLPSLSPHFYFPLASSFPSFYPPCPYLTLFLRHVLLCVPSLPLCPACVPLPDRQRLLCVLVWITSLLCSTETVCFAH